MASIDESGVAHSILYMLLMAEASGRDGLPQEELMACLDGRHLGDRSRGVLSAWRDMRHFSPTVSD